MLIKKRLENILQVWTWEGMSKSNPKQDVILSTDSEASGGLEGCPKTPDWNNKKGQKLNLNLIVGHTNGRK